MKLFHKSLSTLSILTMVFKTLHLLENDTVIYMDGTRKDLSREKTVVSTVSEHFSISTAEVSSCTKLGNGIWGNTSPSVYWKGNHTPGDIDVHLETPIEPSKLSMVANQNTKGLSRVNPPQQLSQNGRRPNSRRLYLERSRPKRFGGGTVTAVQSILSF